MSGRQALVRWCLVVWWCRFCVALPAAAISYLLWQAQRAGEPLDTGKLLMYCSIGLILGLLLPNMWLRQKAK